ncbi:Pesticin receptor [termite gut metagenome]|uniref:Pesticin receptor n=1 Tax=termite gut metagenome TaxID=433724 RepID=A0A5J4S6Q3_9ZZZZ
MVNVEDILIIASPKENRPLREQSVSATLLTHQDMIDNQVISMKDLTALVPNIFIPDYGSKLTSAIYIRGIGSRMYTPSVGLYVDDVPYMDKSAYDFSYIDIERIDVMRGPQGTLYGRNTMGGLIKIYTKSPLNYKGTDLRISMGAHNDCKVSLTNYRTTSNRISLSMGGFYEYTGGFFDNTFLNKKIDYSENMGGRIRGIYFPAKNLSMGININYEDTRQGGYAYGTYDKKTENFDEPAYNDESGYRRNLFNTNLSLRYSGENVTFSSVTGYQYLKDHMFLDEDFTPKDVFFADQHQHQNSLTEEIVVTSRDNSIWDWVTGAFGFYQQSQTNAPFLLKEQGVEMLRKDILNALEGSSEVIDILDQTIPIYGLYKTPVWETALFHQSTINNLLFTNLSAIIGLRLDYEQLKVDYDTHTHYIRDVYLEGKIVLKEEERPFQFADTIKNTYKHILPKYALKYSFSERNNIYTSISRGYRSGGYNIQTFAVLMRNQMTLKPDPPYPSFMETYTHYRPEYSWNYEIGSHITLWKNRFIADLAMFYTDVKDQQVIQFSEEGFGRAVMNIGGSYNYGFETAFSSKLTKNVTLNVNYGYTKATMANYVTVEKTDQGIYIPLDYGGKQVPFVPEHTFSISGHYVKKFNQYFIDELQFQANYTGLGKVYWTPMNDVTQNFYGTLNGRISVLAKKMQVDLWARNILDKKYLTFYFEPSTTTLDKGFAQRGKPLQFGMDVKWTF